MNEANSGTIAAVRGSVVDAYFSQQLPALHNELRVELTTEQPVVIEVMSHLSSHLARGIALTPTRGLARGAPVIDTGHPLQVPVGTPPVGPHVQRLWDAHG